MSQSVLEVSKLCMHFPVQQGCFSRAKQWVKAVDDVSFSILAGQTLGLVGESGCGKSTVARCLVRLLEPTGGVIRLLGRDITHLSQRSLRKIRQDVQLMFQDPADALNPRMDVRHIIEEPLVVMGEGNHRTRQTRVLELLERVGLPASSLTKFPHEFSGGQRQRISIARALSHCPKLLVLDEPVSALDAPVQSQVLNLLMELQRELGLAYLFISHDLSVVRHVSDRVAVMYAGKIVEEAEADELYRAPRHAYTRALLAAVPTHEAPANHPLLMGEPPSPIDPPLGSAFGRRIGHPLAEATVGLDLTPVEIEPGHLVAPDPCALSPQDVQQLGIILPSSVCPP